MADSSESSEDLLKALEKVKRAEREANTKAVEHLEKEVDDLDDRLKEEEKKGNDRDRRMDAIERAAKDAALSAIAASTESLRKELKEWIGALTKVMEDRLSNHHLEHIAQTQRFEKGEAAHLELSNWKQQQEGGAKKMAPWIAMVVSLVGAGIIALVGFRFAISESKSPSSSDIAKQIVEALKEAKIIHTTKAGSP